MQESYNDPRYLQNGGDVVAMNTKNIAAWAAVICALTVSSFAHAGAPVAGSSMQLGSSATPPRAFLEFCSRQPADCQMSRQAALAQIDASRPGFEPRGASTAAITGGPTPALLSFASATARAAQLDGGGAGYTQPANTKPISPKRKWPRLPARLPEGRRSSWTSRPGLC
jgi:hypothetical protein